MKMFRPLRHSVAVPLAAVLALAGCSQQGDQAAAPAPAQPSAADVSRKLDTYRQLLRIHNDELAVQQGHDILDHFPNTDAAKEVQQTLPAIEQRWKSEREKNRLAALWYYQVTPMAGGTQSTATIYSNPPSGENRVQLVLRRHTAWGQNAFLYGSGHGFVCRGNCTLPAVVDGRKTGIKVFAPPSGEPALMIRDDKAFVALLAKAKKISLDVTRVDGEKKETLVYEVGGFDPEKWKPLPKGKK